MKSPDKHPLDDRLVGINPCQAQPAIQDCMSDRRPRSGAGYQPESESEPDSAFLPIDAGLLKAFKSSS